MSSFQVKTKYNVEGNYGLTEEKEIFANHNNSSDYVTFYDSDGEMIMCVPDTLDNNILEAINRLYAPHKKDENGLLDGVEQMTKEDIDLITNNQ